MIKKILEHRYKKFWIIAAIIIILAIAAVLVLVVIKNPRSSKGVSGPIKTINTQSSDLKSSAGHPNNTDSEASNSKTATGTGGPSSSSGSLVAPYGSLVSNHKPGQNGSNLTELSQCVTTPGATCYLKFMQNNIVKTLPAKTVDSTGTTFWDWKINDAELTSGQWTVTAVATLNGQIKTTTDQLPLEVQ